VPERILQFLQHPTIRTSGRNAGGDHVRHDKHARERYASDPVFLEAAILRPCFWNNHWLASFWRETKDPEGVQQDSPGRKPWVQGPNCGKSRKGGAGSSISTPDKSSS